MNQTKVAISTNSLNVLVTKIIVCIFHKLGGREPPTNHGIHPSPCSLANIVKSLLRTGHELGMRIEQPGCISLADTKCKPIHTSLLEEQGKVSKIEIVIIILAKNTNYAEIKQ
ncbi:hypothetical protein HPB51_012092 [Rhipicephalus microplus]|uniref:Uncharacterized protein n=1 Tax=Rhipicephalus microplus TaxID=6941 RepID=A0A9J6D9A1_RHIMP|nr:hypothetical protein HPB51_012092 [Rhipicephalus microplus]